MKTNQSQFRSSTHKSTSPITAFKPAQDAKTASPSLSSASPRGDQRTNDHPHIHHFTRSKPSATVGKFRHDENAGPSIVEIESKRVQHTEEHRCTQCRWVHEADSTLGTSFHGVSLCPLHAAAPELLTALKWIIETIERDGTIDHIKHEAMLQDVKDTIAKAGR